MFFWFKYTHLCGVRAICAGVSHKVFDGASFCTFMQARSTTACFTSQAAYPRFIAPFHLARYVQKRKACLEKICVRCIGDKTAQGRSK